MLPRAGPGGLVVGCVAGTLTKAPNSLIAVLATAMQRITQDRALALDSRDRGGADGLNAELGLVGLGAVQVSCNGGEDDIGAGRAGQAAEQGELGLRRERLGIAGGRLGDSGCQTCGQVDRVELVGLVAAEDGQSIGRTDRVDGQRSDERTHISERPDESFRSSRCMHRRSCRS